jgi:hypothetical protein
MHNAPEVATDASGWATITICPTAQLRLRQGGPLVIFVRAITCFAGVST